MCGFVDFVVCYVVGVEDVVDDVVVFMNEECVYGEEFDLFVCVEVFGEEEVVVGVVGVW